MASCRHAKVRGIDVRGSLGRELRDRKGSETTTDRDNWRQNEIDNKTVTTVGEIPAASSIRQQGMVAIESPRSLVRSRISMIHRHLWPFPSNMGTCIAPDSLSDV